MAIQPGMAVSRPPPAEGRPQVTKPSSGDALARPPMIRWDAVVLLQMGGPATLDEIQPFLHELFADPDIIRLPRPMRPFQGALARVVSKRRAPKVAPRYAAM